MNLQDLTDDELAALLKKIELEQERRRQKAKQEILNKAPYFSGAGRAQSGRRGVR